MSQENQLMQEPRNNDLDDEIDVMEIVNFFVKNWLKIFAGGVLGIILGVMVWVLYTPYQSELILINNSNSNSNSITPIRFDYLTWRTLQKSLPNLANELVENKLISEDKVPLYDEMSIPTWWQKNVLPTYALTKADTKDLASIGKDLDSASTQILNIVLTSSGKTKEEAINKANVASEFLKGGSALLQVKSLLNVYASDSVSKRSALIQDLSTSQIEIGYLKDRLKKQEELLKKFPSSAPTNPQVIDPKDSGAKFMPLPTQIIATNTDINRLMEQMERTKSSIAQIDLMTEFNDRAQPLVDKSSNGLSLIKDLLVIEQTLRSNSNQDPNKIQGLDQLRSQLNGIFSLFQNSLSANTQATVTKKGKLKIPAIGFFLASFLTILWLIMSMAWRKYKIQSEIKLH